MATKELQEKLFLHYKDVISKIEKTSDISQIRQLLDNTHTNTGICNCARKVFGQFIYYEEWVTALCKEAFDDIKWADYPGYGYDKKEIINLLQIRLDNLKILIDNDNLRDTKRIITLLSRYNRRN